MTFDRRYYIASALSILGSEYRMDGKVEILDDFIASFDELLDFIDVDIYERVSDMRLMKAVDERDEKSIRTLAYMVRIFAASKNHYYWSFNTPHNELPWGEICEKALANVTEKRTFTYGASSNRTMFVEYRTVLKHYCHNQAEKWLAQSVLGMRTYAELLRNEKATEKVLEYFRSKDFVIREHLAVESIRKTDSDSVSAILYRTMEKNLASLLDDYAIFWQPTTSD